MTNEGPPAVVSTTIDRSDLGVLADGHVDSTHRRVGGYLVADVWNADPDPTGCRLYFGGLAVSVAPDRREQEKSSPDQKCGHYDPHANLDQD